MKVSKCTSAGTLESSDVYVEIEPSENGLSINLESVVLKQFGGKIQAVIKEVLKEHGVENANIRVTDRGALECVIRARVETALLRAKEEE